MSAFEEILSLQNEAAKELQKVRAILKTEELTRRQLEGVINKLSHVEDVILGNLRLLEQREREQ